MKSLTSAALAEQRKLGSAPVAHELYLYKQYPGPIVSITPPSSFAVEGDATAFLSVGDTIIFTDFGFDIEAEIIKITYLNCQTTITIDLSLWSPELMWGMSS